MDEIAFCRKHKFNIFTPSCLPRKIHHAPSCDRCKGFEAPIEDCLTREYDPLLETTEIKLGRPIKERYCDYPNCNVKHYSNGYCRPHFNMWWTTKGQCQHFNKDLSRAACDHRKRSVLENHDYCKICKGKEWLEIKS